MENLIELSDKELCCVRIGLSKVSLAGRASEVMSLIGKIDGELNRRGIVKTNVEVPYGKQFSVHKEFKRNEELIFTTQSGKPF